jgi:predicted sulfurtransferase
VFGEDEGNLKPKETLRSELAALGVANGTMVVAYCTGGIRSGCGVRCVLLGGHFD